ncbi:hypothetical protein PJV89_11635 [Aliarcobacter butzleri]|uniref:Uncharacterized protein n=1 Tax=Aliarcobacter butzleri L355 TaxID=1447263 RepID=A0A0G9KS72_9BACT|nr:hypothetical protein [Aliarcobacter butzleri]KLE09447.1 hypothetical protein AF80_06470 [Aliarcobacter butzleri L355]MDN5078361.1 hypothetical protein [Aliarcobacter butzleri]MDN5120036.1 hypothetical protein [Aliarcobacter butzleri]BAK71729.1 hypothetical protein ABED_2012 [Aliarcobacter butzleri ED-1]
MTLESTYGSFKSITSNLNKKTVNKEFWKKEKGNIENIVTKGKEEKKSMVMTTAKYYKAFSL